MTNHLKYHQFLNIVKFHLNRKKHNELKDFVYEVATRLPEYQRGDFVALLETLSLSAENDRCKEISDQINAVIEKLKIIQEGKKYLNSEYNDEWDDWYNSHLNEYLFYDPEKLVNDIEDAILLVDQCVDMSLFKEGCELCERLCNLEILAKGDYYDSMCSLLSLETLYNYELISGNIQNFARKYLYLCYMNDHDTGLHEIYRLFQTFQCYDVCLKDILKIGNNELPDFDVFLESFFCYLAEQREDFVRKILMEIQTLIQDDSVILENVKKYGRDNPYLYVQILEMNMKLDKDDEMLKIGLEALDRVPENLVIRSQIGLLTANYAKKQNKPDICEQCWLKAFRSNTNAVNYLRLRTLSRQFKDNSKQMKEIIDSFYARGENSENTGIYKNQHETKNQLTKHEYCVLLFFEQQFEKMEKEGMSVDSSLRWAPTFMKAGMSLMLLLLYREPELLSGGKSILKRAMDGVSFKKEAFYQGTGKSDNQSDEEAFYEIFKVWKKEVHILQKVESYWVKKIELWIESYVAEIMGENRRSHYEECASFVAAFGEVIESLGEVGAKAKVLSHYQKKYPRKRSFKGALKMYE